MLRLLLMMIWPRIRVIVVIRDEILAEDYAAMSEGYDPMDAAARVSMN